MFARIALLALACAAPTYAPAQDFNTMLAQDAARLAMMWDGGYDNANQVNEQERYKVPEAAWESRRHKIFKKVDLPAFGPNVTYVEQYLGEPPTSLYRQRLYVHRADVATGQVVTDIYSFRGKDAEKVVGAHKDASKLKGFSPANMDKLPDGCAIYWRASGEGFRGIQDGNQCRFVPPGMSEAVRLSDHIVLTPTSLVTTTKMSRDDGSLVQGNPMSLPETSYKARQFTCFMIIRNADAPNGYERYNDLAIHDQGGEFVVTTKHKDPLQIKVWMLNLIPRAGGSRPTLMLYAEEENKKFERVGAFGSVDASRLAVVAGFGEANCTLAK